MPGHRHQAFVELFVRRPELAAELLATVFGLAVPAHATARTEAAEFTDLRPVELRADVVIVMGDVGKAVFAVVVEMQMGRDARKRRTWPGYLTAAGLRWECPVALLVVCADEVTAAWCRQPIETGHPGFVLIPLVLGPALVPVIDDPAAAARTPELAVMSAVAHGGDPAHPGVLDALLGALAAVDPDRAELYADIVLAAWPQALRRHLEALMRSGTYEFQSDFFRGIIAEGMAEGRTKGRVEGRIEGRVEGRVRSLLAVLEARRLAVSDDVRVRIEECTDIEQLEHLTRRAVTVASAAELFD